MSDIVYKNEPSVNVAQLVASRLSELLGSGKKVLWLLSGGSGGQVCIDANKLLTEVDFSNLYVTMSDERYGEVGHADENYRILTEGGLVLPGANFYRPLQGVSRDETTDRLIEWLSEVANEVDYKFAVMGVGEDGHTAGVKPLSPAVDSQEMAEIYQGDDFERLTVTASFIADLDEAIVQAYGPSKHGVIKKLIEGRGELNEFPALAIRKIKKVTIFSDLPL